MVVATCHYGTFSFSSIMKLLQLCPPSVLHFKVAKLLLLPEVQHFFLNELKYIRYQVTNTKGKGITLTVFTISTR